MRVVVAPNALKGSLSALEAAAAISRGISAADPSAEIVSRPIADGGDGTRAVLAEARGGITRETVVPDPLGRPVRASFTLLDDGETAVLDVASASGLALLEKHERDPLLTSSRGTGKLLRAALDAGARNLIVGLGGSATVDGGAGLLAALGIALLDGSGAPIPNGGAGLSQLQRIDCSRMHPALREARLRLACDVESPLLGTLGAARVFGPQKGASPAAVDELERQLAHFANVIAESTGRDVRSVRSGGAAGGIAAGLFGVLGASLESGIDLVLELLDFDQALADSDWVVTAEGQLDRQTLQNKGPCGVGRWARRRGVPVIALAGGIADDISAAEFDDFAGLFCICQRPLSLSEALPRACKLLERSTENLFRLLVGVQRRASSATSATPEFPD